jgi:hypothetical protein
MVELRTRTTVAGFGDQAAGIEGNFECVHEAHVGPTRDFVSSVVMKNGIEVDSRDLIAASRSRHLPLLLSLSPNSVR